MNLFLFHLSTINIYRLHMIQSCVLLKCLQRTNFSRKSATYLFLVYNAFRPHTGREFCWYEIVRRRRHYGRRRHIYRCECSFRGHGCCRDRRHRRRHCRCECHWHGCHRCRRRRVCRCRHCFHGHGCGIDRCGYRHCCCRCRRQGHRCRWRCRPRTVTLVLYPFLPVVSCYSIRIVSWVGVEVKLSIGHNSRRFNFDILLGLNTGVIDLNAKS
ncbi:hypothetical protein EDB86DRAFT_678622 [Lactarius hatsudake]|nr:hypothetical protein EDB86DRAFT_678622 [Lactarius hatsudake]